MKLLKKFLAVLLCLGLVLSFAACSDSKDDDEDEDNGKIEESSVNEGDPNCQHTYGDWETTTERTCTANGLNQRTCTLCGKQEQVELNATGHTAYDGKCETCGKTVLKTCKHSKTETVVIEASSCTDDGLEHVICNTCKVIIDTKYIYSYGHEYDYVESKEPTCTEEGWYSYSVCKNCDYTTFEAITATGHEFVAGKCTVCKDEDADFETITAEQIAENQYVAVKPEANPVTAAKAEIITKSGEIKKEDQVDKYSFTATHGGTYRIGITELYSGNVLKVYLKNNLGETVSSNTYCENNEGLTAKNLVAGATYTVEVCQYRGTSTYNLVVACQKPALDITANTEVKDSIEFIDQENVYTFSPAASGTYRFEIADMQGGTEVKVYVYNRLGETVNWATYCENGDGVTAGSLVAGETYQVSVYYQNQFSDYTLKIGKQAETVDVSEYTEIKDSITFYDQINYYKFVVPANGTYRFQAADMLSDTEIDIQLLNHLGESVSRSTYCENGDGITVKDLKAGDVYTLRVEHRANMGDYTIIIGSQKPAVEVNSKMAVKDSIKYGDQVNVYNFTADVAGDHTIIVTDMAENTSVVMYVFDADGDQIDYEYCDNFDGITLSDVEVGDQYRIEIRMNYYLTDYTLSFNS